MAIGSGGNYATAAAKALRNTEMRARSPGLLARRRMRLTNDRITLYDAPPEKPDD